MIYSHIVATLRQPMRPLNSQIKHIDSDFFKKKRFIIRAIICLLIGLLTFLVDEKSSFDLRFKIRSPQKVSQKVTIINTDTNSPALETLKTLQSLQFEKVILLNYPLNLLSQTQWDENQPFSSQSIKEEPSSPEVIWALSSTQFDEMSKKQIQKLKNKRIAIISWLPDSDLIFRRYPKEKSENFGLMNHLNLEMVKDNTLINFRGPKGTFETIHTKTLTQNKIDDLKVKNKFAIFDFSSANKSPKLNTPVGPLSAAEYLANVIENNLSHQWVYRLHFSFYLILLILYLAIASTILFKYPQTIAFIFFIWLGTCHIALSLWIFDSYYLWVPILSPLSVLFSVFVIFTSLQLALQERHHWRLAKENQAIQEIELLKNNFVSLFSHDLKTPIAKIQAIVDRLLAQNSYPNISTDLNSLRRSSEELFLYIQKILHVSKVESRKIKLNKTSVDFNQTIDSVIQRLELLAKEKQIKIIKNTQPLFSIEIDASLMEEVLLNIVDNAIKYSTTQSEILIKTEETEDSIKISVEDTGAGIAKEDQAKVWKKFVRVEEHQEMAKGFGLGLYLTKYFIELHGGHISLSSELGKGTTVTFEIPFDDNVSSVVNSNINSSIEDA